MDVDWGSDDDEIECLKGCRFQGSYISTSHQLVGLEIALAGLAQPPGQAARRPGEPRRPGRVPKGMRSELLAEYPWLSEEDFTRARLAAPRAREAATRGDAEPRPRKGVGSDDDDDTESAASSDDLAPVPDLVPGVGMLDIGGGDEDDDGGAADVLREAREDHEVAAEEQINFYLRVLGGAWTMRERGMAYDAIGGQARAWVRPWCAEYHWQPSSRCNVATYGDVACHQLIVEWCRRSEYFYGIWFRAGAGFTGYTRAHVDTYIEHADFTTFMNGLHAGDPAIARGARISAMAPLIG